MNAFLRDLSKLTVGLFSPIFLGPLHQEDASLCSAFATRSPTAYVFVVWVSGRDANLYHSVCSIVPCHFYPRIIFPKYDSSWVQGLEASIIDFPSHKGSLSVLPLAPSAVLEHQLSLWKCPPLDAVCKMISQRRSVIAVQVAGPWVHIELMD